jgi:cytochrome c55X
VSRLAIVMATAALVGLVGADSRGGAAGADAPSAPRQAELLHLLRHDCGSCHGLTLKGGLGPALLPNALSGTPDEVLVATILYGRPGTPMPPWRFALSEQETRWLVSILRKGELDAH